MPKHIHSRMHQRRSKNGIGAPPRPSVKKSRDGSENHVAPIREAAIRNMREAKKQRSSPPARKVALRSPREQVLQQSAEQKLFRPRRKKQNSKRNRGQTLPLVRLQIPYDEVQLHSHRNCDARER